MQNGKAAFQARMEDCPSLVNQATVLKSLAIENYQAVRNLELDIHPGLTVFTGTSNTGKSSIMRALRWCATNITPSDFRSWDTDATRVGMLFDDHTVIREQGDKLNRYWLDGDKYEAFGRKVPEGIARAINMPEACWKQQHDNKFMVALNDGERARLINAIAGVEDAPRCVAAASTAWRDMDNRVTTTLQTLQEAEKALERLEHVRDARVPLDALEAAKTELVNKTAQLGALQATMTALCDNATKLKRLARCKEARSIVSALAKARNDLDTMERTLRGLVAASRFFSYRLHDTTKATETLRGLMDAYAMCGVAEGRLGELATASVVFQHKAPDISKARGLQVKLDNLCSSASDVLGRKREQELWLEENASLEKRVKDIAIETSELDKEREEWYIKNPSCPTCGRPFEKGEMAK